jgi:hypothetical protein
MTNSQPSGSSIERLTFLFGPVLFAVLVVGGFAAVIADWHGVTFGDYLQAIAAGAGLVAVGHGIHRSARLQRGDQHAPRRGVPADAAATPPS